MTGPASLSPHGPGATLDSLSRQWAGLYRIGHADGTYTAVRWDNAPLTAGTLRDLAAALLADFRRRITG